jgi:hypothetical protein
MSPEESNKQTLSPEQQAIAALDTTMQRIFLEYSPVCSSKPELDGARPEDTVDTIVSTTSRKFLTRVSSPDGTISYRHADLWMSTGDRGAVVKSWQEGGAEVVKHNNSDIKGNSAEISMSAEDIDALRTDLEGAFPEKQKDKPRSGLLRLFGHSAIKG